MTSRGNPPHRPWVELQTASHVSSPAGLASYLGFFWVNVLENPCFAAPATGRDAAMAACLDWLELTLLEHASDLTCTLGPASHVAYLLQPNSFGHHRIAGHRCLVKKRQQQAGRGGGQWAAPIQGCNVASELCS